MYSVNRRCVPSVPCVYSPCSFSRCENNLFALSLSVLGTLWDMFFNLFYVTHLGKGKSSESKRVMG